MKRRKQVKQKSRTNRLIAVVLVVAAVTLVVLALRQQSQQSTSGAETTLPDSDTSFSIPIHVGQPAPKFTAISADGEPYTVTPGDGRPKVIVFYMGFQ